MILVDNDQAKGRGPEGGLSSHSREIPAGTAATSSRPQSDFFRRFESCGRASEAIFVAVGTPPTEQGEADFSYVESVARGISGAINSYKVVVEKSTVPVYTSDWVRKIMLRNAAAPDSFDIASNPEFLREGTAVTDFLYPDRIVVGADTERCAAVLRKVYAPMTDGSYYQQQRCDPAAGPGKAFLLR